MVVVGLVVNACDLRSIFCLTYGLSNVAFNWEIFPDSFVWLRSLKSDPLLLIPTHSYFDLLFLSPKYKDFYITDISLDVISWKDDIYCYLHRKNVFQCCALVLWIMEQEYIATVIEGHTRNYRGKWQEEVRLLLFVFYHLWWCYWDVYLFIYSKPSNLLDSMELAFS